MCVFNPIHLRRLSKATRSLPDKFGRCLCAVERETESLAERKIKLCELKYLV